MTTHSYNLASLPIPESAPAPWCLRSCLLSVLAIRVTVMWVGLISVWTASSVDLNWTTGIPWIAYDAGHYYHLAQNGYPPADAADDPTGNAVAPVAYFPLYPMASRLLASVMPLPAAMLVLANLCAMVGFAFLYQWVVELTRSARTAFLTCLVMAAFPGAMFFSAGMTEGPFFMLTALTLLLAGRRQYWWAAAACGLASLARPTALALAVTLGLVALLRDGTVRQLLQTGWANASRRLVTAGLIGVVAMSGTLAYMTFLTLRYGEPGWVLYGRAQHTWQVATEETRAAEARAADPRLAAVGPVAPTELPPARYTMRWFVQKLDEPQVWNRGIGLAMLFVCLLGLWKPRGIPRPLFALPLIIWFLGYLPNNGLRASALFRYEMAGLPMFLLATLWLTQPQRRRTFTAVMLVSLGLQVYYAWRFSRGLWVG